MSLDSVLSPMSTEQRAIIDRFTAVCLSDERVLGAFLGGSFAAGGADSHSDLDLGVITGDAQHEALLAQKYDFVRGLAKPLFLEDFDVPHNVFFIMDNGVEGELGIGSASRFNHIHMGPYITLVDKTGLLTNRHFPGEHPRSDQQIENARRIINWFWHDVSHFITAMSRNQLWWAAGQLELLRKCCVNLARLHYNFDKDALGYDKLDQSISLDKLTTLEDTFCLFDREAMKTSVRKIVVYYQQVAVPLAQAHGINYPDRLADSIISRLEQLD